MLGAVPGQSCSVYWTRYRLFKERCRAELQQILEDVGVRGLWKRESYCVSIGWAHESREHGLVMSVVLSSGVEQS